ncbi:MAG: MFS transporter [Eubacterium sp.]
MDPSYKATVSDLLTEEEYVKASGLVSLAGSARYLISPFLAGLLLVVSDIKLLLVIDIFTFVITVITTAVVRRGMAQKKEIREASFAEDLRGGWRAVTSNKGLITLVAMAALMTFCMGAIQILSEPMILDFESSKILGIVETVCASGMLVTSILLGAKGMKKGIVKALCLSLGVAGICMLGFGLRENLIIIGISGFIFFMMIPIANSSLDYLVRTNISNELQGRAWGVIGFISQLGYVISYGLSGIFADNIAKVYGIRVGRGSAAVIMLSGALLTLSAVLLYFFKNVRALEREN